MLLLLLVLMPIDACFNIDADANIDLCVKVVNQSKNPMFGSVVPSAMSSPKVSYFFT